MYVKLPPFTVDPRNCVQMDVCFVVDSSGSICDNDPTATMSPTNPKLRNWCNNWQLIINFMEKFAESLTIGQNFVLMGMVQFANQAHLKWDLTK